MDKNVFSYRAKSHCASLINAKILNTKMIRNIITTYLNEGFESLSCFSFSACPVSEKNYPGKIGFTETEYSRIANFLASNNLSFGTLLNSLVGYLYTKDALLVPYDIRAFTGMKDKPVSKPKEVACEVYEAENKKLKQKIFQYDIIKDSSELKDENTKFFCEGAPKEREINVNSDNRILLSSLLGSNSSSGRRRRKE